MGSFSIWHWIVVLVVIVIIFGAGKLPNVMGDVAKGIKSFKRNMTDDDKDTPGPAAGGPGTLDERLEQRREDAARTRSREDSL
jgi:sec-independent protein translocase protein TatA